MKNMMLSMKWRFVAAAAFIAFVLWARKAEPYSEYADTGGVGGGLVRSGKNMRYLERILKKFAAKFHSHLKTYYSSDPKVAPLLAMWNGRVEMKRTIPAKKVSNISPKKQSSNFILQQKTLFAKSPSNSQQSNSRPDERLRMRTQMLRFLASKVEGSDTLVKIKDTWGMYLRIATEQLGVGMEMPQCIATGSCDASICPKCKQ